MNQNHLWVLSTHSNDFDKRNQEVRGIVILAFIIGTDIREHPEKVNCYCSRFVLFSLIKANRFADFFIDLWTYHKQLWCSYGQYCSNQQKIDFSEKELVIVFAFYVICLKRHFIDMQNNLQKKESSVWTVGSVTPILKDLNLKYATLQ